MMNEARDPVALAEALIACESVTPARGPVFDALEAMLAPIGFGIGLVGVYRESRASQSLAAIRAARSGAAGATGDPA